MFDLLTAITVVFVVSAAVSSAVLWWQDRAQSKDRRKIAALETLRDLFFW